MTVGVYLQFISYTLYDKSHKTIDDQKILLEHKNVHSYL